MVRTPVEYDRAHLARYRKVPSPLDGTPVWALTPFTDEEIWEHIGCLSPDEFRRACELWRQRREDPMRAAQELVLKLQQAPGRLMKRRGKRGGSLGSNPVELELTHQFIRRLFAASLRAVRSVPSPRGEHAAEIAKGIVEGLTGPWVIPDGPLRDGVARGLDQVPAHLQEAIQWRVAQAVAPRHPERKRRQGPVAIYGERSMAFWITDEVLDLFQFLELLPAGNEAISERHLRRILKPSRT